MNDTIDAINNGIQFNINLEELLKIFTSSYKHKLVSFITKNFKENIHYIIQKNNSLKKGSGGHNKIHYLLTTQTYELVKNSFNLKHRYLTKITDNCEHINLLMSLENQTIGFIENCFNGVLNIKREKIIDKYRVDLYFEDYNLVIECDENNHLDRQVEMEIKRENYILSKGNTIIRYDPNHKLFELSLVIKEINKIILLKNNHNKLIVVNFEL